MIMLELTITFFITKSGNLISFAIVDNDLI